MRQQDFIHNFWTYYLTLEEDFINTLRYVELDESNYSTYSVEYVKQYQTICSELDVLCKTLCKLIDTRSTPKNMYDYTTIILQSFQDILEKEVLTKKRLHLIPWGDWKIDSKDSSYASPAWWKNYNDVKHNRAITDESGDSYYKRANLENVLNSLAGLFVLEMYAYKKISEEEGQKVTIPIPKSQLFELVGWENKFFVSADGGMMFEIADE